MADTFPRQYARTRRLTLGEPRSFVVSSDGTRVVFARSGAGDDPVNGLWVFDVDSGEEIHVVDAADLLADADAELPAQERARTGAHPRAGGRHRLVRDERRRIDGCVRARRSVVHREPPDRRRTRDPRRGCGVRPASRSDGHAGRVRVGTVVVRRRPRRHDADHRGSRSERVLGFRRVHRRRGDGALPRLLVGSGWRPCRRVQGRHLERRPLPPRRPCRPVDAAHRARVSRGGHGERGRGARSHQSRRRHEVLGMGPRDLSLSRLGAVEPRTAADVPRAVT